MLGPIPQDPDYHRFADGRAWLGIPNAADVLSSGAFLAVGLLGLVALARGRALVASRAQAQAWWAFFGAVALTAFGSAAYHLAPDDFGLALDRLPMALAVAALLSATLGGAWLVPLCVVAAGSVLYWLAFDDLRFYGLVQFGGIAAIVVAAAVRRVPHASGVYAAGALYALAKAAELHDHAVYALSGERVSGHTLKHLLAAAALYAIFRALVRKSGARKSGA